ncbi:MAG: hypothetical protein RR795_01430 [Cetobacterium sp.]|uniref:hypothetical protein n=1 Tax=Cetobacterium sp. TaxID=2071632 RepID=UPI002FC66597
MILKFENKTKNRIFLNGMCFVPGETITSDIDNKLAKSIIDELSKNKFMAQRVKDKLISCYEVKDEKEEKEKGMM